VLRLVEAIGMTGIHAPRVPNTTNIYFEFIGGEAVVVALDEKGVAASAGAACSAGAREPSHVLLAMGLSPQRARGSVRFSFAKKNSAEDVDYLLGVLPEVVQRLRELSPLYKGARSRTPALSRK